MVGQPLDSHDIYLGRYISITVYLGRFVTSLPNPPGFIPSHDLNEGYKALIQRRPIEIASLERFSAAGKGMGCVVGHQLFGGGEKDGKLKILRILTRKMRTPDPMRTYPREQKQETDIWICMRCLEEEKPGFPFKW